MMDNLLSIDPGYNTGYAFFKYDFLPVYGSFKASKELTMENKIKEMRNHMDFVVRHYKPQLIIIEGVGYWDQSDKSRTSASRGDLIKLAYLVGAYCSVFCQYEIDYSVREARTWKKSLSKEGTLYRVEKILGRKFTLSEHIIDAIALGLSSDENLWKLKRKNLWKVNKLK